MLRRLAVDLDDPMSTPNAGPSPTAVAGIVRPEAGVELSFVLRLHCRPQLMIVCHGKASLSEVREDFWRSALTSGSPPGKSHACQCQLLVEPDGSLPESQNQRLLRIRKPGECITRQYAGMHFDEPGTLIQEFLQRYISLSQR
jgi:hypothetical protein